MQEFDGRIVLLFQGIRCPLLTKIFSVFIPFEFWNVIAFFFVLFLLLRGATLKLPVVSFVLASHLSIYVDGVIKYFVKRPRPFLTVEGLVPLMTPHGFSFPSGHATLAMTMAVVLSHHFPKSRPAVYFLAVMVGFSRVYFGVHYLSDVLAGFALGALVGHLSLLLEKAVLSATQGINLRKRVI